MIDAFARDGEVYCQECDGNNNNNNNRKAFSDKMILNVGGYESMKKVLEGREMKQREKMKIEMDKVRMDAERKGKEEGLKEAEKGLMNVEIARIRMEIENICIPRCPRCKMGFERMGGCAAMKCGRQGCGCGFCGYCLKDCGDNVYNHIQTCQWKRIGDRSNYGDEARIDEAINRKIKHDLLVYWCNVDSKLKREAIQDESIKTWLRYMQIIF